MRWIHFFILSFSLYPDEQENVVFLFFLLDKKGEKLVKEKKPRSTKEATFVHLVAPVRFETK